MSSRWVIDCRCVGPRQEPITNSPQAEKRQERKSERDKTITKHVAPVWTSQGDPGTMTGLGIKHIEAIFFWLFSRYKIYSGWCQYIMDAKFHWKNIILHKTKANLVKKNIKDTKTQIKSIKIQSLVLHKNFKLCFYNKISTVFPLFSVASLMSNHLQFTLCVLLPVLLVC